MNITEYRQPAADADAQFIQRWSTRAFSAKPIPADELQALFEAARWAPSCFNEQPWHFIYAATPEHRDRFAATLAEKNAQWAGKAPVIAYVTARRSFARNDKANKWARFDVGAAWMALALQARKLDLYTHAMAGFDSDAAYALLGLDPEQVDIICAVAIGYRDPEALPEGFGPVEKPNGRKALDEVATAFKG